MFDLVEGNLGRAGKAEVMCLIMNLRKRRTGSVDLPVERDKYSSVSCTVAIGLQSVVKHHIAFYSRHT